MARVKGGKISAKRRRNVLKQVKGYRFARSKKERAAKEAIFHAGNKKNDFKRLWNVRINAGLDTLGGALSYSRLVGTMNKKGIKVNRKMLSTLAAERPESFERLVKQVS